MTRSVIWEGNSRPFEDKDVSSVSAHRAVYDDVSREVIFEAISSLDALGVPRWVHVDYVPNRYVLDFAKVINSKEVVYRCFWCDEGTLQKLPGTCPKCKREVSRSLAEMTNQELVEVYLRKYAGGPQGPTYSLAVKGGEEKPDGNH